VFVLSGVLVFGVPLLVVLLLARLLLDKNGNKGNLSLWTEHKYAPTIAKAVDRSE
jgi:hypothetical protein